MRYRPRSKIVCMLVLVLILNTVALAFTGSAVSTQTSNQTTKIEKESDFDIESDTQTELTTETETIHTKYDEIVAEIAEKYSVSATLINAIIKTESDFDSQKISETDDYGLMQINICNAEWLKETLGVTNLLDPKQNIESGVYIISSYLARYSLSDALMAYNCGEAGAKRLWQQGVHSTHYTQKVLNNFNQLGGLYE